MERLMEVPYIMYYAIVHIISKDDTYMNTYIFIVIYIIITHIITHIINYLEIFNDIYSGNLQTYKWATIIIPSDGSQKQILWDFCSHHYVQRRGNSYSKPFFRKRFCLLILSCQSFLLQHNSHKIIRFKHSFIVFILLRSIDWFYLLN